MVKFKVNYGAHISRAFVYLDYDALKLLLHEDEEGRRLLPKLGPKGTRKEFVVAFEEELQIVDNCYMEHMIDLEYSISDATRLATEYRTESGANAKAKKKAQEAALKRSLTLIFDKLTKIETYCLLNRTAAIKILKKHDKVARKLGAEECYDTFILKVNRTRFGGENKIDEARRNLEELYARLFCNDILEEARGKLRLAKIHTDPRIRLSVTFKVGIVLTLLAWLLNYMLVSPKLSLLYMTTEDPSVYVYAMVGSLVVYRWFWGFSVYMWDSVNIDYILILDLDASKHMPSADEIFSDAANLSILYMINVLVFHALRHHHIHHDSTQASWDSAAGLIALLSDNAYVMPILLVLGTVIRMLYSILLPASYGVFSGKTFWSLFTAPLSAVELRHTIAADIQTSLVRVVSCALYSGCYFASGSYLYASTPTSPEGVERFAVCHSSPVNVVKVVIFAIPVYIRIMQCLRQRRDALIRHKLQQENDPRKPGAGKLRVVKVKPSSALAGKRGASGRVATDSGSGRSSGIGGSGGDNDGVVTLFGDDAPADSDVRDLEENAPLERKEDDEQDEQDERDEPDEPDEPFERPKLSRSESVDMPLPTVFQMLCPDTSYSLVPEVVRKCWNTIWVWPYSFNALKYFLGLCVIIFGAFPPQDPLSTAYMSWYIPLMAISSLYASYWDIANDFQLMQLSSTRPLLRDKLLYEGNERFYYFVMVVDPALRFLWTLSFTPYGGHPFYVLFEIVRRSLWACLRMEIGYIQELARRR